MTATDELRRMLDERGVEHTDAEDGHTQHTWWPDGDHEIAACNSGERLAVYNLTPEQAIEATLGRGTCHAANVAEYAWDDFECSECGWVTWSFLMEHEGCGTVCKPRFCPNCGAKVVD